MDSNMELLATVGMSETFNPADAPDEGAWVLSAATPEEAAETVPVYKGELDETESLLALVKSLDRANE
jgi:hypothetical protein